MGQGATTPLSEPHSPSLAPPAAPCSPLEAVCPARVLTRIAERRKRPSRGISLHRWHRSLIPARPKATVRAKVPKSDRGTTPVLVLLCT